MTTKHRNLLKVQEQRLVHCWICDARVDRDTWIDHLKSSSHNRNANILRSKLPKPSNKRKCLKYDFVTDDYIVAKSEEALEGCFLTLRVTPRHDIVSVSVLIEELPELLRETLNDRLRE